MSFDFMQLLMLLLIALLFGKDTILPAVMKKFGLTNGNGNQKQIDQIMSDIKDIRENHLFHIEQDIAFIKGLLDK